MKKKTLTSLTLALALVLAPLTQDLVMAATATGNNSTTSGSSASTATGNNTATTPGGSTSTATGNNTAGNTASGGSASSVSGFVFDAPRSVNWGGIAETIEAAVTAGEAENVNVVTGRNMRVPASVLSTLAGKNVTLAMHTGNGLAVSVTGTDLRNAGGDFNLTLSGSRVIPEAALNQVLTNAVLSREFSMEEKVNYPFHINVHMSLGAENAGKLAVLYYYDEASGTMKAAGSFRITENGAAMFGLNRGDEYIVVVGGTVNGSSYTIVSGDTLGAIAARNGVTVNALLAVNPQITDRNRIFAGQTIVIP